MVLYYGLFALEAANSTIAAAARSTTDIPTDRLSLSRKQKIPSNSIGKVPSSTSSSNSWIYTEDLRKRFEERYADCHYIFVPVYIDRQSARHNHSTIGIIPPKIDRENSWMYSKSLRDRLFYSSSKISLPIAGNISSSACCVTNRGFMRDELPVKKDFKSRLFKRSLSAKEKITTNLSLSSSISSFSTTNNLLKHRSNDVVEEEDDEGVVDENHSVPLIKHDSVVPATSRTTAVSSIDGNNNTSINPTTTHEQLDSTSSTKAGSLRSKKLTRLRSFFSRTSFRTQQPQRSTLTNPISRT